MQEWFKLAVLALKVSVFIQVVGLGLGTTWQDATYLLRRPRLLVNSVLARNVVLPMVTILLIKAFSFHPALAITLGTLAVTPVPPLLPRSQLKGEGHSGYVMGLLVSQALLAIVLVPITVEFMSWVLGAQAKFGPGRVSALVAETILIPLASGMAASRFRPKLCTLAPRLLAVGTVLLFAGAIPLLLLGWKAYQALVGNGALLALSIFVFVGTAAGHALGGPQARDRTALAMATSSRHPGLALAIANANFPDQSKLVAGAIVIYLILRMVLLIPYLSRRRSRKEA